MIFIGCFILLSGLHTTVKSQDVSFSFDFLKFMLNHFQSPSAIFILDETGDSSDTLNFIKLQKLLSLKGFYSSVLCSSSVASQALGNGFQSGRETAIILKAEENLSNFLQKLSHDSDISSHKWLLTSTETPKIFEKLKIPLGTEFVFARGNDSGGYDLFEMYDIEPGRKVTKSMGRWITSESFHLVTASLFSRRKNLQGATVKVLSSKKDPCSHLSLAVTVGPLVQCIHKKIWEFLAEMLNATTEIVLEPKLDRDSIRTADAELSLRSAPVDSSGLQTRSYLWPVFKTRVEVVVRYLPQIVEWTTFILPFSSGMWMIILVWMILSDLVMAVIEFTGWKQYEESFLQSYNKSLLTSAFVFCNQGAQLSPTSVSYRITFLMMLIVPGVLFPGYSASLTSFLTVNLQKIPFRNLHELSRSEYKLGWHGSYPLENMFNLNGLTPLDEALLQNNVLPMTEMPRTDIEGVRRLCDEKFVFLTVLETLLALKPKCKYYILKQHFKMALTSMEIRKNSWYLHFLNRCERTLDFTGILYRTKLRIAIRHIKYEKQEKMENESVSAIRLENIVLPFVVLLLGVVSSWAFLALEGLCWRLKAENVKTNQRLSSVLKARTLRQHE